jgi:outer membrane receptor protein involved in Fe transport
LSRTACGLALAFSLAIVPMATGSSQAAQPPRATITGRVVEATTGQPLGAVTIAVEGLPLASLSDSTGHYQLSSVPPGPQVLQARRLGFALARVPVTVPSSGSLAIEIAMATVALRMTEVHVTADANGRARGELGSASVITREAIANQGASSLAGILEFVPGVPLQPPGLDAVQQVALRAVPTTSGSADRLAAFGTLIILDGVPLSNNANLQTAGPRGEIVQPTAAGGGIDIRRIPAAALERVEVIRGVPSARYGDLTQGAIVIDTRAGVVAPEIVGRYDPRTAEGSIAGGRTLAVAQNASLTTDLARTQLAPGVSDADVWRATVNGAHRLALGYGSPDDAVAPGIVFDTRASLYQVYQNQPEQPDVHPGISSSDRSGGIRLAERARFGGLVDRHIEVTASVEREWQNTESTQPLLRGAEPFTDLLVPGRSTGHFVQGVYPATARLDGAPWHIYTRFEGVLPAARLGGDNTLRVGAEFRREWNAGPGYQFNIEFPPQVAFNGVNGYDRPRRYDAIPPVATSAAYVDDRFTRVLPNGMALDVQAGLRADVLHSGTWWTSGARDVVLQPRVNVQLSPVPSVRLRAGWGRTAKTPALGDLYPAPQYYDVVNVNWYPPNAAERLAVLTTSIKDPTNPGLGFAVGNKAEAGFEVDLGRRGAALSVVAFVDGTTGGVGYDVQPTFLLREHFALRDSTVGTGRPPQYVTPAQAVDTVPIFIDRPRNLQRIENRGVEWTLSLPEIQRIRTHFELQGAWTVSRLSNDAVDLGQPPSVSNFQLDSLVKRAPYWKGTVERGERALTTARFIHHQPALGLVITGTVQYFIRENTVQEGVTDTLAWAGYVTRTGTFVPVPAERRGQAQYADLRRQRVGLLTVPASPAPDWMLNLQVAKTVFGEGRLAFQAFNALDRLGQPATISRASRIFQPARFGVELTLPTSAFGSGR